MSVFESIVLGIVQGLTEFLPVSSTAHLRIVPAVFGWEDPGSAFTAVTQLGTMAAVVIYFWGDLWRVARAVLAGIRRRFRGDKSAPIPGGRTSESGPSGPDSFDERLGWYLLVGTIPIVIFGFTFRHQIDSGARNLYLISAALIGMGLVLAAAEKFGGRLRKIESIRGGDAIAIGVAQAMALVPGVSRSGATISAGMFLNFRRQDAARYSFLLSVPAVVLSGLFKLPDALESGPNDPGVAGILIATFFAFVVGYASIAFLLRWLGNHSTYVFVGYRIAVGVLVLVLTASGTIT